MKKSRSRKSRCGWQDDKGQYYIDRSTTPTPKEQLAAAFSAAVAKNPDVILVVDASKDVDYGTVIQALDIAKEAKIKKSVSTPKSKIPTANNKPPDLRPSENHFSDGLIQFLPIVPLTVFCTKA